ncbi:MAG: AMP-binding protein, partial [Rhodospirillales bacterium]|nr:AMP-binding protein [Rhodospirillales bacterium]
MSSDRGIFEMGLGKNPANYQPLTPISFLNWAETVYPNKIAVIHGDMRFTYREFGERCRRLASALNRRGVGKGDAVALMSPNAPPMLEAHFGVPMTGAVLNSLNFRLDASTVAFILRHGEAKVLITDREFSSVIKDALVVSDRDITVIDIDDPLGDGGELLGEKDYEAFLAEGESAFDGWPSDEWDAICLNYTSGT